MSNVEARIPYLIKTDTLHFILSKFVLNRILGGQTNPESWNTWFLDYLEINVNPEKENITYSALDAKEPRSYIKSGFLEDRFLYLVQAPKTTRIARKQTKAKTSAEG